MAWRPSICVPHTCLPQGQAPLSETQVEAWISQASYYSKLKQGSCLAPTSAPTLIDPPLKDPPTQVKRGERWVLADPEGWEGRSLTCKKTSDPVGWQIERKRQFHRLSSLSKHGNDDIVLSRLLKMFFSGNSSWP